MGHFRFKLEQVLQYRHAMEEKAKHDLAGSLAQLKIEETRLQLYSQELTVRQQGMAVGVQIDLNKACLEAEYRHYLEDMLCRQVAEVARSDQEVQSKRAGLLARVQERRAMDSIKKKQQLRHDYQVACLEQRHLDEAGRNLFLLRGKEAE
jgi:flagellar export protein FliJ